MSHSKAWYDAHHGATLEVASAHIMGLIALNYSKKREASRAAVEEEF